MEQNEQARQASSQHPPHPDVINEIECRRQRFMGKRETHEDIHPNPWKCHNYMIPPQLLDPDNITVYGQKLERRKADMTCVDDEASLRKLLRAMSTELMLAFEIKRIDTQDFKGKISLLVLSTFAADFVVDVTSLGSMVTRYIGEELEQKLLVGFHCDTDVVDLIEQLHIRPLGVVNLGRLIESRREDAGAVSSQLCFHGSMISILGKDQLEHYHPTKERMHCQVMGWTDRPLTEQHVKCAATHTFLLTRAWKEIIRTFDPHVIQSVGCNSMKKWIVATVWAVDIGAVFATEWKIFMDQQPRGYIFPDRKMLAVWSTWNCKQTVAQRDKRIMLALRMRDIVHMVLDPPQTPCQLERFFRAHPSKAVQNIDKLHYPLFLIASKM